jgi:hypothetical protein
MRFASLAFIFLCFCHYSPSTGQTLPASRPGNMNGSLPEGEPQSPRLAPTRPESAPLNLEKNRQRLLSDLQTLIAESQALQQELQSTPVSTVSAQSLKRSQKIESLSKKIHKAIRLN